MGRGGSENEGMRGLLTSGRHQDRQQRTPLHGMKKGSWGMHTTDTSQAEQDGQQRMLPGKYRDGPVAMI